MNMTNRRILMIALSSLALGSTAALADTTPTSEMTGSTTKTQASADQSQLSDAEIASIVRTANEGEVKAAQLAEKKGSSKDVKSFAQYMIKEHSANTKKEKDLASRLKIKPQPNQTAETFKNQSEQTAKELASLTGTAFDQAYINNQINAHQRLLTELDQNLIPAAKNPELKQYLETTKSHVQHHLERAQKIQKSMSAM